jgi:hypothetical protein
MTWVSTFLFSKTWPFVAFNFFLIFFRNQQRERLLSRALPSAGTGVVLSQVSSMDRLLLQTLLRLARRELSAGYTERAIAIVQVFPSTFQKKNVYKFSIILIFESHFFESLLIVPGSARVLSVCTHCVATSRFVSCILGG